MIHLHTILMHHWKLPQKKYWENIKVHWKNNFKLVYLFTEAVLWDTWIHPNVPVESILLASLTVSPQISNTGFVAPITPQTRGPTLMPVTKKKNSKSFWTQGGRELVPKNEFLRDKKKRWLDPMILTSLIVNYIRSPPRNT